MIAARLTVLGASAGLVVFFGWALEGWPRKAPATPCPPGRFLVDPGNGRLVQGSSTPSVDSVTVDGQGRISIGSGCLAVVGRITPKSHFTKLTAKWPSCGNAGTGKLKAKIVSPDCGVMTGRFKTRGAKPKAFTARRSTCGDGIVDEPGGEQCEPTTGGCPGGAACTAACTCESSETTTTTVTATSSTTTTVGYTCSGLLGHRCGGTCPDGQTCAYGAGFPPICGCQPTCGASAPACNGICPSGEACRPLLRLDSCACSPIIVTTTTLETTTTIQTTTTTVTTTSTLPCGLRGFPPTCGGSCPPDFICTLVSDLLHPCQCLPPPPCGLRNDLTCGGACPPNFTCRGVADLLHPCQCLVNQ